ncbi:4463_t:CDS:2 [Ambispora gerdemannii]|uniref:valine--tRNA ligase n=1 Tax=Ambispora gerdemannii TaxID=144530 RepID=A0A9N9C0A2_9GLOM|nr:4463_t:CDS:2 [Ambispora gerdemannii]
MKKNEPTLFKIGIPKPEKTFINNEKNWPNAGSVCQTLPGQINLSGSKISKLRPATKKSSNDYLLVVTSRPETIFADVALLVNPQDQRYQKYLGQQVQHPFTKKIIPILADQSVKIDFGSGVLKCTPGHDFTDYELGKKHQLPLISCCNEKGVLNELAGPYQKQVIGSVREKLVAELTNQGVCEKIENYETNLVYSAKSGVIIEPLLSRQ